MHISELVARTASAVETLLLPTIEDLLAEPSEKTSLAYLHYKPRATERRLFLPCELALATKLLESREVSQHLREIRLGVLSLLLAPLGFEIDCVESDPALRAMGARLLQTLAHSIPLVGARLRFLDHDGSKQSSAPRLTGTLVLATNALSASAGAGAGPVRGLEAYDLAIINARTFANEDRSSQEQLFAGLRHLGFVAEPFLELGPAAQYYLLRRQLLIHQLAPPFHHAGKHAWTTLLPEANRENGDSNTDPHRSSLWVLEDHVALGPPHAQHGDVRDLGKGRYSHWGQSLNFSTGDNSDPNSNGRTYSVAREYRAAKANIGSDTSNSIVDMLADILKSRGIGDIAYFHTDHFEPWHGANETNDDWWRGLERFAELTRRLKFGGRSSLFYTPLLIHRRWKFWRRSGYRLAGDGVVFRRRPPELVAQCQRSLRPLEADIGHEFHIHIHHEGWTNSDFVHPEIADWMARRGSPTRDSHRFDFYLGLSREVMAEEIGRPFDRWAFTHGNWALNASNPASCRITDELAILQRHGCYGDFTFPAGESHGDPCTIEGPFTCTTPSLPRAYDRTEATPRPLSKGANDLAADRFLVWNSRIKGARSSLDFYAPHNQPLFAQPEFLLRDWLAQSVVIDDCLYIKTHAHSMHELYRLWESDAEIPHSFPQIRRLFDLLERVAERAKIPVAAVTVDEVMSRLTAFDRGTGTESTEMSVTPPALTTEHELKRAERLLFDAMPSYAAQDDGFYRDRIGKARVLESYEWEILHYARQHLDPSTDRIVEVGAGWGMLSILLAVLGFEVVAYTGDPLYAGVSRKLSQRLASAVPRHRPRLRIVEGFFPDALTDEVFAGGKKTWLVSTNLIHGFSRNNQDRILAAALRFDRVILDIGSFGVNREDSEREELRDQLTRGFEIEASLWLDRLLLMKPRSAAGLRAREQMPDIAWLVARPAPPESGSVELPIPDGSFLHQDGHRWDVELPPDFAETGGTAEFPDRSPWRLLEDGVLLGPQHALHADIAELGSGRYSHWGKHLHFSTSDNSDPATNGRKYTLAPVNMFDDLSMFDGFYRHQDGHWWYVELPPDFAETGGTAEFPHRSPWRLLEDGALLGPPHSLHADIAELGSGRYSHWGKYLHFSTSDNSDPATNGRKYTLARAIFS